MDDTPDKDQAASPAPQTVGSEPSPDDTNQARIGSVPTTAADPEQSPVSPVVSHHGGGKKRWPRILFILLLVAAIAGGGWYFYKQYQDDSKKATTAQSKNIPLLKVGVLQADFGNLYPDMTPSSYALMVNSQMFEGLVRYENTNKIVPDLAIKWTNPDDKTWLFTIKPGVKFHDGNTLTNKDVKYSLDTVIANNSELTEFFASTIASVDLVGTDQVKITTKEPDPVLLNRLTVLYIIDSNAPEGSEPSQAGTGPYMIKPGTKPTGTDLKMTAFNDYHGGRPTTQALDFSSDAAPDSLVKAFKDKKLNIAGPVPVQDVKKNPSAYKFISSEPSVFYVGFNTTKPGPLQNKLVREAIRYAVDPKAIGEANGNQVTPISQVVPPSIPGYNPSITPYKQNIEKAKQLLAQAGYPDGVTVRLSAPSDSPTADELVKELKQAGITATVDTHADFDEYIEYFSAGQADMFTISYTSDTLDGLDINSNVFSSVNYSNPKFTALLDQIGTTTDPAKRLKLLQEAADIINDDVAVVPVYSEDDVWLMDKNYAIEQDMPSSLISVYFYKVQLK